MVHILAASSLHLAVKSVQYSEKKELLTKITTVPGLSFIPNTKNRLKNAESSGQGQIEHKDRHYFVA